MMPLRVSVIFLFFSVISLCVSEWNRRNDFLNAGAVAYSCGYLAAIESQNKLPERRESEFCRKYRTDAIGHGFYSAIDAYPTPEATP